MLSSKSFYVIGTLALLFVSSVFADDVFVLTESNFDKEVGQDRGALVEFYAPWCEHCKKLALEYEKLGASFKKAKSVLIGKVDCDEHKSLCSKYGVSGYPTIQWFPKGFLEPKKYEGACGAEALAEFVNKERMELIIWYQSETSEDGEQKDWRPRRGGGGPGGEQQAPTEVDPGEFQRELREIGGD